MTYNFFLATLASAVLYCFCWLMFFNSIPEDVIEKPEDVPFLMVFGFIGKSIAGWATSLLAALTLASIIKDLL